MINWFLKTISLVFVTAFLITGCKHQSKKEVFVLDRGPDVEMLDVPADYVDRAIKATGGLETWMTATKLQLDSVVTFYKQNGSSYLTEHHYKIYPWSNSIQISAKEPLSNFIWQLSDGRFEILEGDEKADLSPMADFGRDFAEIILAITTAPVRFLDRSTDFLKKSEPVKVEGLWYYPIEQTYRVEQPVADDKKQKAVEPRRRYWSKVVFLQSPKSSLVDILWFADIGKKKFLVARGYDYYNDVENKGILIPAKIEIFTSDTMVVFRERLAEIEFK